PSTRRLVWMARLLPSKHHLQSVIACTMADDDRRGIQPFWPPAGENSPASRPNFNAAKAPALSGGQHFERQIPEFISSLPLEVELPSARKKRCGELLGRGSWRRSGERVWDRRSPA